VLPFVFTSDYFGSVAVIFAVYASINLMWMLVIGTAGIFSFATIAIAGFAAYFAAYLGGASRAGYDLEGARALPVVVEVLIAIGAGAAVGALIAAPAIRLRGVYFALFTIGLVETFRAIVVQQRATLGGIEGLYGATTFKKSIQLGTDTGRYIDYFLGLGLVVFCLIVYWLVDGGRLGLLLRTARESEPVARALGISVVRARFAVFVISSAVLGLIGGFYVGFYGGVSPPQLFGFDKLLLLLAMIVVGGLGSAKGAILGTGLLLFIDQYWNDSGASRLVAIGIIMLAVTLGTSRGLVGLPAQLRGYWDRYKGRKGGVGEEPTAPAELEVPGL
jgi:branched-chain amino acid transport system permease protein